MKALFYSFSRKNFQLRDIPVPRPKKGEILIRVKASALCGTDLHIMNGPLREKAYDKKEIVLGHSFSGIVHEPGKGVKGFKKSQKVFGSNFVWCGQCSGCRRQEESTCDNRYIFGMEAPGSHAEFIRVPQGAVFHLPPGVDFGEGSLICDLLAVAIHAFKKAAPERWQSVIIFGAGPVGLTLGLLLKIHGFKNFYLAETSPFRRRLAGKLLNCRVFAPENMENIRLADVVFEASGQNSALEKGYRLLNRGGKMILLGVQNKKFAIEATKWISRQLMLQGVFDYDLGDVREAAVLCQQRKIKLKKLITHVFALAKGERAYKLFKQGKAGKIVLWV